MSQKGFMAGFLSIVCWPVASRVAEPELIRWITPPAAKPVSSYPVTRLTAAGLQ